MISFKKHKDGKAIAIIKGGNRDGENLYLYDKMKKEYMDKDVDILDFIEEDMFYDKKARRHTKPIDMAKIIKALKLELEYILEDDLEETFQNIRKIVEKKKNREVVLHSGELQFIPDKNVSDTSRHVLFVGGQGGSGKSYYSAEYAKVYLKMFPKFEVFIFSQKDKDKAYDDIMKINKRMHRIILDDTFLEGDPLTYKDFYNTLMIFDDVQCIKGPIGKAVHLLRKEALELGRADNISVIMTEHIFCDGESTKPLINESTHFVFFQGANINNVTRLLINYVGMKKEDVPRVFTLPSKWKVISKGNTKFVMYQNGAYIFG